MKGDLLTQILEFCKGTAYGGMEWESFILPADDRADDGQKPCLAYIYATSPCLKIREDIHKANSFFPS